MSAPRVYRWDDANAPVARGERRSLVDILHACLVTGYGSKPAAGWTREYVNATFDKAAFRNSVTDGTGFYLQVDGTFATTAYTHSIKAFETMTSETAGLGPFSLNYGTSNNVYTSTSNSTIPRPWLLIADNRAFYFFVWQDVSAAISPPGVGSIYTSSMFFGDCIPRKPDDYFCCGVTMGHYYYGSAVGYVSPGSSSTGSGDTVFWMPRPVSGVNSPLGVLAIRGGGPGVDSGPCGSQGPPWSSGEQILLTRPHLNNGAAYSLRGWLPGYYYPCHPLAFGQFATISSDGMNFFSVRHSTAGGQLVNSFISLDDWRS